MPSDSTDRYLIVSDNQEPYGATRAIQFAKHVQNHFNIPDENCYHVGDENDCFHGGSYPKGGDYPHTPTGEIKAAIDRQKEWYAAFPFMNLAISNHGLRWLKKASFAEIPSQLLRQYREVFQAPEGWQWKEEWIVNCKQPFRIIHGMGYSGKDGARNAALDAGMSTCIGHLHSHAGIAYMKTQGRQNLIWGMNVGCLIDIEAYVFKYGKYSRAQPCLGLGVVLDSGKLPIWLPYE